MPDTPRTDSHAHTALAFIGIGSNLAEPLQQVQRAVAALQHIPASCVLAVSPWYGSRPVGGPPNQPNYINGVISLQTTLTPHALLDALQAIEQQQHRERSVRWGPRTLDLDLLLYDNLTINDERLIVPHPRLQERAFVLKPLHDIAPQLVLPNGWRVASLLSSLSTDDLWLLSPTDTPA